MSKETKKPRDLGIKIGTKEEIVWTDLLKVTTIMIEDAEKALIANKGIKRMCEENIEKEKSLNR